MRRRATDRVALASALLLPSWPHSNHDNELHRDRAFT